MAYFGPDAHLRTKQLGSKTGSVVSTWHLWRKGVGEEKAVSSFKVSFEQRQGAQFIEDILIILMY